MTAAAVGTAVVCVFSAFYMGSWNTDAIAVLVWCLMGMAVKWGLLQSAQAEPGVNLRPVAPGSDAAPDDEGLFEGTRGTDGTSAPAT